MAARSGGQHFVHLEQTGDHTHRRTNNTHCNDESSARLRAARRDVMGLGGRVDRSLAPATDVAAGP